jgi:hypothetical protein
MIEKLLEKQNLSRREKLAFFRSMLKREMDVMNEYCVMNLPPEYRAELCHIENIKKLNLARLLQVIEYYDPDFIKILATTDPRVRTFTLLGA